MKLKKIATVVDWDEISKWEEYIRRCHERKKRKKWYGSKRKSRTKDERES